ncbi:MULTISPECIES: cytochrome d ubiquinol oxidase subunit II [Bacillus]|uniref:Cytochrome d ubiquinol oxidase subunit 2 n=2 Tax=Bacillus TaxID=1386 RepID=A0A0M3R8U5_9BACI|nr:MULTISPECIES: cytochrome d ubiquinol oxidase subunit II [Bacillus]ALC80292.1 cytochrome d ubiquinol oxidase subunit 2 [Bacillus gobiensis]MBP1083875.1 cytochrome d ubiquinol oxidase subunit II [Bacillus capparidis]MED1098356.1 cytochrome d ubiquinol oxidase subunit II [Bacillus capparidis]
MLSLNEFWFIIVSFMFVGFIFLEGFDFGVGMSGKIVAKSDAERRVFINTIGPFWDANEVWLITAVGAMFAAFPNWYATLLSGFYLPFVILLLALIGRGVAFEFRGKAENPVWRSVWDWIIFFGSLIPPLVFGIVFSALVRGVPIDKNMQIHAGLTDIVNVYTVLGGITLTMLCLWHGLLFATLRTVDLLRTRCRKAAKRLLPINALLLVVFLAATFFTTDVFDAHGMILEYLFVLGILVYLLSGWFITIKRDGWAFFMSGMILILLTSSVFIGLFPRVMISTISDTYHLTIQNAASGPYSLQVMTYLGLGLLPFVLGYQIWSYYVFRKRVDHREHMEY